MMGIDEKLSKVFDYENNNHLLIPMVIKKGDAKIVLFGNLRKELSKKGLVIWSNYESNLDDLLNSQSDSGVRWCQVVRLVEVC